MELHTVDGLWSDEADEFGIECVLADGFSHDSACEPGCPDGHLLARFVILARDRSHFVRVALAGETAGFNVGRRDGNETAVLHRIAEPIGYDEVRRLLNAYLNHEPGWNTGYCWNTGYDWTSH